MTLARRNQLIFNKKRFIKSCISNFLKVAKKSSSNSHQTFWKRILWWVVSNILPKSLRNLQWSLNEWFEKWSYQRVASNILLKSLRNLRWSLIYGFEKMILSTVLSNISIKSLRNLQWNLIKWFEEWSYHSLYQTICQNHWEIFSKIIIKYSTKSYQEFEKESYQMFC